MRIGMKRVKIRLGLCGWWLDWREWRLGKDCEDKDGIEESEDGIEESEDLAGIVWMRMGLKKVKMGLKSVKIRLGLSGWGWDWTNED